MFKDTNFSLSLMIFSFFRANNQLIFFLIEMSLGTLTELIEYFNLNPHIFQKQRTNRQHMQRIMSMLSQQNMEILEQEFELYPKGLQLPTFIYLMKKLYSPQNEISKYYFVSDLIKFFQAIDINGDGHLQWSQFTQYIIENIRRIDKPNYKNKVFQQNQVISSAYSKISNQYKIVNVIDTSATSPIKKLTYVPKECKYYMLEAGSNTLKIFDEKFQMLDYLELTGESPHSFIIDFSFDKGNMIFAAIFQNSIRYCNLKVLGNVKTCNEVQVKKMGNYHKVEHLPLHNYWAFLSKHGELKLCSASYRSRTGLDFSTICTLKQHQSLITDICEMQQPQYIVTSSMDGNVKFYSSYLKKTVTLEHVAEQTPSAINSRYKKGVLGIDYSRQFGNYLLSYGFCSSIYIYALDVSLVKGFTGKYKQHAGNLITAKFLRSFPYILSFDDKLSMRIWDFRTLTTIQIINCQKNFINPSRLQIIPQLSQCLVCEKKITQFRAPSLQKKSRQINQFHAIFDFRICSLSNDIFVFTSNDVRVYNHVTGSLEKVFTKLNQNSYDTNITACEFGYKSRKFFVGDAAGFVREYCSETGEFLQSIDPGQQCQYENKGIIRIIFLKEHSLLIVCSLDGRVMVYLRNSQSQFEIIRDLRQTHYDLTCAEASARYCSLATGSEQGIVNLWSLQKLALQGVIVLKQKIVHVAFSPIHPILTVAEQNGILSFFHVRPHDELAQRNQCFAKVDLGTVISSLNLELVISAYMRKDCSLFEEGDQQFLAAVGRNDGQLDVVNLSTVLTKFNISQNHQICSVKKSIKCEVHSMKTAIQHQRKKVLMRGYSNDFVPTLSLECFPRRTNFQAHKQRIDRLLLVKQSGVILTTSWHDKKLKVFSLQGQLNGAIDFFTFKKLSWRVGQMNFYKKLQAIDTTIYSMRLIENKRLTPQQQEFIKVNLLINQYMTPQEKEEYFRWVSILRRTRIRRNPRRTNKPVRESQEFDARDEVAKFGNLNKQLQSHDEVVEIQPQQAAFNQIYTKLVAKIKDRLDKSQFPSIDPKKDIKNEENKEKEKEKDGGITEFITTLRKTLKVNQDEEKKYQKEFALAMNRKVKAKKQSNNMLYQSLIEVRKNIEAMQKKQRKSKKIL